MDGVTYVGEGRSKKQAKLVAAKNALSTFLAQQQQQQQLQQQMGQFVDQPFPAIEFNRGAAVVDVDFTSDDPADANFIIDTMNRIQTAQIPMSGGPLTQLTGNTNGGAMKPPPTSNNNNKSGNEEERESLTFTSPSDEHSKTTPTTIIIDTEEKKKKTGQVLKGVMDKENHNDSGLVVEEEEMEVVDLEYDSGSSKVKEDSPSSMDSDDSGEEDDEEDGDVKLTPEILEIIRISVEYYIDYDEEVQSKYWWKRRRVGGGRTRDLIYLLFVLCCPRLFIYLFFWCWLRRDDNPWMMLCRVRKWLWVVEVEWQKKRGW